MMNGMDGIILLAAISICFATLIFVIIAQRTDISRREKMITELVNLSRFSIPMNGHVETNHRGYNATQPPSDLDHAQDLFDEMQARGN